MRKQLEKILKDLVNDYESTREMAASTEVTDLKTQEVLMQAMANNLVLVQTQLNVLQSWQSYLNMQEEHKKLKS